MEAQQPQIGDLIIAKLIALLAFSLVFLGFNTDAKVQAGGSAFSGAVTAATGNTNICSTGSDNACLLQVTVECNWGGGFYQVALFGRAFQCKKCE